MVRTCLAVLASILLLAFPTPAAADASVAQATSLDPCAQSPDSDFGRFDDFDGDGKADVVIGVPGEDLDGKADAGRVEIRYGDGRVQSLHLPDFRAGDRFGAAVADLQVGTDVCSDLVVGAPGWDSGAYKDTGVLSLFTGTPDGLRYQGWYLPHYGVNKPGANFGAALAGTLRDNASTSSWWPRSVVYAGAPGADVDSPTGVGFVDAAGAVLKLSFTVDPEGGGVQVATTYITEASDNMDDAIPEPGDHFGASISADGRLIGAPGKTVAGHAGAGAVLAHYGHSDPGYVMLTQNTNGFPGTAEAGDHFGAAVYFRNIVGHRFYVGAPGESIGSVAGAGNVTAFDGTSPAPVVEFHQGKGEVQGAPETNDHFGAVFGTAGERVVVGTPNEDVGRVKDAGAVFALESVRPGDWMGWTQNTVGIPGAPEAGDRFGATLGNRGAEVTVVGVPGENSGTGLVLDGLTGDSGSGAFWNQRLGAPESGDGFGSAISSWYAT